MGYHPETMVCGFPPYPGHKARGLSKAFYALKPFIGFDVWHIDPERRCEGQRSDDSCGWFDRRPREYADAVRYLLDDKEFLHEISRSLRLRNPVTGVYGHTYPRMSLADTLAVVLMVAGELELRRWWNGQDGNGGAHASVLRKSFTRRRNVGDIANSLALHPLDNLSSVDDPASLVWLVAGALHRNFRPWWRHPRWHVHHWQINFDLARNLKRMFQPCGTCRKPLGFGYCPHDDGSGALHHGECIGRGVAASTPAQ